MSASTTPYRPLLSEDEHSGEEDDAPPVVKHTINHATKENRWNHIEDLDGFFSRVYKYHQEHGFTTIILTDILELMQFMFIVTFSTFLVVCLRYDVLFSNTVEVDSLDDLIDTSRLLSVSPIIVLILLVAMVFWAHQLCRAIWRAWKYWEIRMFYTEALKIPPSELKNYAWEDVLKKLQIAQKHYKMNIRKQDLTELDIHHRILRFNNFMVAMVNRSKLPCKINIPLYGEKVFFSEGLRYNYEMILFWGYGAAFDNSYHLNDKYKQRHNHEELTKKLQGVISIYALVNILLFPVILLYRVFHIVFHFAELIKRQPGALGTRHWTLYAHTYLRHFNELDHELKLRLNQAYLPASKYMDIFVSQIVVVIARNVAFIAGSLLAVLAILTVVQEQLLTADNVLAWMSLLGVIVWICSVCLPDENRPLCAKEMMLQILTHIQYMPDNWKEQPHTAVVHNEFSQLFQFKLAGLIDELLSPIMTPFVLYLNLRPKAKDIVSFLHDFTIDVSGVGDVCSFAEMNVRQHGSPDWMSTDSILSPHQQAELGKTELSLVQFHIKHPTWQPPEEGAAYLSKLKESLTTSRVMAEEESLNYISICPSSYAEQAPQAPMVDSMQWSIWSIQQSPLNTTASNEQSMDASMLDTLQLHKLHDQCTREGLSSVHISPMSRSMYSSGPPALIPGSGAHEPLLPHSASDNAVIKNDQKP